MEKESLIQIGAAVLQAVISAIDTTIGRKQGGYPDVDGSIDHYDSRGIFTLREAPAGSRRADIVGFGPNAGKKFKIRK